MVLPEAAQIALVPSEQKQLEECEIIIASGWNNFVKVGRALATIRDQKLYRQRFTSFEEYCTAKWHYTRYYAYRLIDAAQTTQVLLTIVNILPPTNEAQVRPLIGLGPEEAKTAWTNAVKAAEGKPITAKLVLAAARPFRLGLAEQAAKQSVRGVPSRPAGGARTQPDTSWITVASYRIRDVSALLKQANALVGESDSALRSTASSGEISAIHQKAQGKLKEAIEALEWLL